MSLLLAIGFVEFTVNGAMAAHAPKHRGTVSETPPAWTPAVDNGSVRGFAQVGGSMVAVGDFSSVTPHGGSSLARDRAFAFSATTGAVAPGFAPSFNGAVNAVLGGPTSGTVYVAGDFTQVNGKKANRIALLKVSDGSIVPKFKVPSINYAVNTIERHRKRLYAGGNFTQVSGKTYGGLASFNATTGVLDKFVENRVTERHNDSGSGAQGWIGVRDLELTPDGTKMAVIGNFKKVDDLPRDQLAVLDLNDRKSVVSPAWRTRRYEPYCFNWAFDSYMRGVGVSPDGSYFVVTTTGGQNAGSLCDAAARWEFGAKGQKIQPTWVDYSGGDTLWGVEATDHVVYIGGHHRWMNNSDGSDYADQGAVPRPGLAALDPKTGVPVKWNAGKHPLGAAAYELYATSAGLWMGMDTEWVGNRQYFRPRLAFFPLAGGGKLARDNVAALPATVYRGGFPSDSSSLRSVRLTKKGAKKTATLAYQGVDFSGWRGSFLAGGKVWYGTANGSFKSRAFKAGSFGPEVDVNPYDDPVWAGVRTGNGDTYDGSPVALYGQMPSVTAMAYSSGRLFYTRTGSSDLYWRWFSTDSGIIGSQEFTANAGRSWSGTAGMFATKTRLYYVPSKGTLRSIALKKGLPSGSTALVNSGIDWHANAVFLGPKTAAPNGTPTAAFSSSCVDLVCTFDATGSSSSDSRDGTLESYTWDFGPDTDADTDSDSASDSVSDTDSDITSDADSDSDADSAEGRVAQHEFTAAGTHTVTLTVTDDHGATDTQTHQVEVTAPAVPDPAPEPEPTAYVDATANADTTATPTAAVPASTQPGDLLLLTVSLDPGPAVTTPAGWTLVDSESTPELSSYVFSKVATATDPGASVTVALDSPAATSLTLSAYRNASGISTATTNLDAGTTEHAAPEVTLPSDSWVVWFWATESPSDVALSLGDGATPRAETHAPTPTSGQVTALLADTNGPRTGPVPGALATSEATSDHTHTWSIVLESPGSRAGESDAGD